MRGELDVDEPHFAPSGAVMWGAHLGSGSLFLEKIVGV